MSGGRTHRPELDHAKCEVCGGCTHECPASVFKELAGEKDSLRGSIFTEFPYDGEKAEMPPRRLACPLGQDVPSYIGAIASNDLDAAATVIRKTNALPSVCGRVCIASCMRACTRAGIDEGLNIRALKRFAVHVVSQVDTPKSEVDEDAPKVAVIGAGPAGLAAAHRLVQLGVRAIVFESSDKAGECSQTGSPVRSAPGDVGGGHRQPPDHGSGDSHWSAPGQGRLLARL